MKLEAKAILSAAESLSDRAIEFLGDLVATPSLSGSETAAINMAEKWFSQVASVQRCPMDDSLIYDRDYCDVIEGIKYTGRDNLRVVCGPDSSDALLLNSHIDTVPPSQGQVDPYIPRIMDGQLFGRGACDANGQVVVAWLAMAVLKQLGIAMPSGIISHVVCEEENGGNGTLAMVRRGEKARACVVLEPTDGRVLSSIRGAVWFRINVQGRPGHSGMAGKTTSALKHAIRIVEILEKYHADLLAASRGGDCAEFDGFDNPMPLTVGKLHAGNWPATAPGEAVLEGVLGLLPNRSASSVMQEMTSAIHDEGGAEISDNFDIHFSYRHDCSVTPVDASIVTGLSSLAAEYGLSGKVDAMTASCDAWLYNNQLNIPTVVFGPGSLSVAHSNDENMPLDQLAPAAAALAALALGID